MNHNIVNVQLLHDQAKELRDIISAGYGRDLFNNLSSGVRNLEQNWIGADAAVQIQNVVGVHNALVVLVNALGEFAVESSKVASNYREIQRTNGATSLEGLSLLTFEPYTNISTNAVSVDTIAINSEATNGREYINSAVENLTKLFEAVSGKYREMIEENWTQGTGRDSAIEAFNLFSNKYTEFKTALETVAANVKNALINYGA